MARSTVQKTIDAADTLLEWLQSQRGAPVDGPGPLVEAAKRQERASADDAAVRDGPDKTAAPEADPRAGQGGDAAATSARRAAGKDASSAPWCLPHTDWLHHRLVVTGPAEPVAVFRSAAAGAGTVPWRLDLDRVEEDCFHLLLSPSPPRRSLSVGGARVLAGQLREAAAVRHAAALARVGRSRACPLDLHALVPVPDAVLRLGPDHPDALAWLWAHWGTTDALRHVAEDRFAVLGRHPVLRADPGAFHLGFWSADWTPWRALATVAMAWPALRFDLRPTYDAL